MKEAVSAGGTMRGAWLALFPLLFGCARELRVDDLPLARLSEEEQAEVIAWRERVAASYEGLQRAGQQIRSATHQIALSEARRSAARRQLGRVCGDPAAEARALAAVRAAAAEVEADRAALALAIATRDYREHELAWCRLERELAELNLLEQMRHPSAVQYSRASFEMAAAKAEREMLDAKAVMEAARQEWAARTEEANHWRDVLAR